jgi:hypothetical protein
MPETRRGPYIMYQFSYLNSVGQQSNIINKANNHLQPD